MVTKTHLVYNFIPLAVAFNPYHDRRAEGLVANYGVARQFK